MLKDTTVTLLLTLLKQVYESWKQQKEELLKDIKKSATHKQDDEAREERRKLAESTFNTW